MTSGDDNAVTSEPQRLRCFVIGPIGNRFAAVGSEDRVRYEEAIQTIENVIQPACEAVGLTPVRADGLARAGEITEQVFRRLRDDDVVIADLTGANANVMYELGLRHTRTALTVQIGEYNRLPFDISAIRTIQFSRSIHGLITARDELIEVLQAGLAGQYDLIAPTRVWNEIGLPAEDAPQAEDEQPPEPDELDLPGFVDLLADAEANQQPLVDAIVGIGERVVELGGAAQAAAVRMADSDSRGGGMQGRLVVANQFATEIDEIAGRLESDVTAYKDAMASVSAGTLALIEQLEQDPSQLPEAIDVARLLRQTASRTRTGVESTQGFVETLNQTSRASRVMRAPARRVTRALEAFAAASQAIDEWDRRLQVLGIETPPDDWEFPAS